MFRIGDRVKIIKSDHPGAKVETKGTVVAKNKRVESRFLVEFDEPMNGHSGEAASEYIGKTDSCWWFDNMDNNLDGTTEQDDITIKLIRKRKNNFY